MKMEAWVGIEPAYADLQSIGQLRFFNHLRRHFAPHLAIWLTQNVVGFSVLYRNCGAESDLILSPPRHQRSHLGTNPGLVPAGPFLGARPALFKARAVAGYQRVAHRLLALQPHE